MQGGEERLRFAAYAKHAYEQAVQLFYGAAVNAEQGAHTYALEAGHGVTAAFYRSEYGADISVFTAGGIEQVFKAFRYVRQRLELFLAHAAQGIYGLPGEALQRDRGGTAQYAEHILVNAFWNIRLYVLRFA